MYFKNIVNTVGITLSVASKHLFVILEDELICGVHGFGAATFGIKAEEPGRHRRSVNRQVWRESTGTLRPSVNMHA